MASALLFAAGGNFAAQAQQVTEGAYPQETYSDLANLVDSSGLVLRAKVKNQAVVEPERAPGLAPGFARLYVEAETQALLAGRSAIGQSLRYLVDVPLDAKGKVPKLRKQEFILFARSVPGRPGEIQLVDATAQLPWSVELEARLRPIMSELFGTDVPPKVDGVRDALSVAGNLAGESETQIFLKTADGSPWSISVVRRPNMLPVWGASRAEIVDQSAKPPLPETIAWYRLACSLPETLPSAANLASDAASRRQAQEDYSYVIQQLGQCKRNRS